MNNDLFDDEDEGLFQRHRWLLPVLIIAVGGGAWYGLGKIKSDTKAPVKAPERIMSISIPPPPPPPPPKVEQPEPPKEEMVAQEEVKPDEQKPDEPKPADEPPPISTALTGDGPGMAGLGAYAPGQGNGMGIGGGRGKGGSKFGWYAAQVQRSIVDAMRGHKRLSDATFSVKARIWADGSGRIVRASLASSSGDAALDAILTNEVLTGLKLTEPPPADMPMPIVMRLNAKAPAAVVSTR